MRGSGSLDALAKGQIAVLLLAGISVTAVMLLSSSNAGPVVLGEKATPASFPGGVAWNQGKGYSFVQPESLEGPQDFKGQLAKVSQALDASIDALNKVGDKDDQDTAAMQKTNSEFGAEMYSDTNDMDTPLSPGEKEGPLGSGWKGVSDVDYKRDLQRGVLKEHSGFPELPQCPTEGLWGGYRKGYMPGQPGGNCQDASLVRTGWQAAHLLRKKKHFDVGSWDELWKQDLHALKRTHSYYQLTKGLWSKVAPDATMAYYMPNDYHGSLERQYELPAGESGTENAAHANSIVPVPNHPDNYYASDFRSGRAHPEEGVGRVYGNLAGSAERNSLRPLTQGLRALPQQQQQQQQQQQLQQQQEEEREEESAGQQQQQQEEEAEQGSAPEGWGGEGGGGGGGEGGGGGGGGVGGGGWSGVVSALHALNAHERARVAASEGVAALEAHARSSLRSSLHSLRPRSLRQKEAEAREREAQGEAGVYGEELREARQQLHQQHTARAREQGASLSVRRGLRPPHASFRTLRPASSHTLRSAGRAAARAAAGPGAIAASKEGRGGEGEEEEQDAEQLAAKSLHQFRQLRSKFRSWARYFKPNSRDDVSAAQNKLPPVGDKRGAYFWCYAHYSDYSPDAIQGDSPAFEECLHSLGGYAFGDDEHAAFGPSDRPRDPHQGELFGIKKGKAAAGFGEGIANTLPPTAWKYFEATD